MKLRSYISSIVIIGAMFVSIGCSSTNKEDGGLGEVLPIDKIEASKEKAKLEENAIEGDLNANGILDSTELDALEKLNGSSSNSDLDSIDSNTNNKASVSEPITSINKNNNNNNTSDDNDKYIGENPGDLMKEDRDKALTSAGIKQREVVYAIRNLILNTPNYGSANLESTIKPLINDLYKSGKDLLLYEDLDEEGKVNYAMQCNIAIITLCEDVIANKGTALSDIDDFIDYNYK